VERFGPAVGGDSPTPDLDEVIALDAEVRAAVSEPSFGGAR
jgi:hypothetical protein